MPRGTFSAELKKYIHPLTTSLLLPVFFIYSGLNTRIDLVNSAYLWVLAFIVLALSILGKGVACFLAAKFSGESHRDSLAIGTLMNARGLMELIILNIGLQQGIIKPALFSIMVMMAICTTLMTTPFFEKIYRRQNG